MKVSVLFAVDEEDEEKTKQDGILGLELGADVLNHLNGSTNNSIRLRLHYPSACKYTLLEKLNKTTSVACGTLLFTSNQFDTRVRSRKQFNLFKFIIIITNDSDPID